MNTTVYGKRFDTGATVEVTEDFTLPDYQPEMRRVIGVRANTAIDGKYLTGEELEADGAVTYAVLYADESGRAVGTSQTSSYTGHIPLKSEEELYGVNDIVLSATVENVTCRVTAPRRFTLTSRVHLSLTSQKAEDISCVCEGEEATVRRKTSEHKTAAMSEIRKSTEASGTVRTAAGSKPITADASVLVTDVRVNPQNRSEVAVKGEVRVSLLAETADGDYTTAKGSAPFEETVSLPEFRCDRLTANAFASVVAIELDAAENGDVSWRTEYDLDVVALRESSYETTDDAYLVGRDSIAPVSTVTSYAPRGSVNGRLTLNGQTKLRPGMRYLTSWGTATAERCDIVSGKLMVSGSVRVTAVTVGNGETLADECVIPYRAECDATGMPDSADGVLHGKRTASVVELNAREDGETLKLTAELSYGVSLLGEENVLTVAKITPLDERKEEKSVIRVYVPDREEDAWAVAKKFCLPDSPTAENGIYIL